ncbi:MAG: hypothetical protein QOD99_746 [Chthoniobacter sp.]|nr:hypothetical protein [Chthoniobacter sp.]
MKATPDQANFNSAESFNAWIDDRFQNENGGSLQILGQALRPSEVLHRFSFAGYLAAFPEFKQHWEETLITKVVSDFPILIAHPFYRFLEGSENETQRFQFLRDTWEGLINCVHALVVSEARAAGMALVAPAKCGTILTDKLSDRLDTIEQILTQAAAAGLALESANVVDLSMIATIKQLNQTRNAFSHTGAIAEDQAKNYITECLDDVFDVLDAFSGLKEVRLMRYDSLNGMQLRHERFDGHANTKRFGTIALSAATAGVVMPLLSKDETLMIVRGKVISVRPFITFIPHAAGGHVTQVAFLKKTKGAAPDRRIIYEIVGEANEIEHDRTLYQPVINDIRALFGEPAE